jgi:glycerate kinase
MKKFFFLLLFVLVSTSFLKSNAQSCPASVLTDVTRYYCGFESDAKNFTATTGSTQYAYRMPSNGTYEIVNYAANVGDGGYLYNL